MEICFIFDKIMNANYNWENLFRIFFKERIHRWQQKCETEEKWINVTDNFNSFYERTTDLNWFYVLRW